jgi:tellurite resistance protein
MPEDTVSAEQLRQLLADPTLSPLADRDPGHRLEFLHGLVDVCFLASHGDGRVSPGELKNLTGLLDRLASAAIERDELAGLVYDAASLLERDGLEARLAALTARFPHRDDRARMLAFATLAALGDGQLPPGERAVLDNLARRLDVPLSAVEILLHTMLSVPRTTTP